MTDNLPEITIELPNGDYEADSNISDMIAGFEVSLTTGAPSFLIKVDGRVMLKGTPGKDCVSLKLL